MWRHDTFIERMNLKDLLNVKMLAIKLRALASNHIVLTSFGREDDR